jgi:hypothetical protein
MLNFGIVKLIMGVLVSRDCNDDILNYMILG